MKNEIDHDLLKQVNFLILILTPRMVENWIKKFKAGKITKKQLHWGLELFKKNLIKFRDPQVRL